MFILTSALGGYKISFGVCSATSTGRLAAGQLLADRRVNVMLMANRWVDGQPLVGLQTGGRLQAGWSGSTFCAISVQSIY